jgi:septal ring factor EnvC (AmiA/AmiB activator)
LLSSARRSAAPRRRFVVLALLPALLSPLLAAPAQAGPQDRAELSQVQRKLDRVRRVLENARSDADDVAAALEQADRDVAAAQAALAEAQRRFQAAQAKRRQAALEAARAKLEAEAQQAVIDRRAYATYVNSGASAMLTLVVDADNVGDLLDRSKLLENVARSANTELQALVDAKVAADAARRRAVEAEQEAAAERVRMQERAAELEAVRAARAAAKEALERKIDSLQSRQGSLRARSTRLVRRI